MHDIHEIKEKMKDLCAMADTLTTRMKCEMDGDLSCVDTHEAGEVMDMIKDVAETEMYLYKAAYYKTVVEAMEKGEDGKMPFMLEGGHLTPMEGINNRGYIIGDQGIAGYNNYRYPSSGCYTPSGSGAYYGYMPTMDTWGDTFYGYSGNGNNNGGSQDNTVDNSNSRSGYIQMPMNDSDMENMAEDVMRKNPEFRRGMPYRNYAKSRRYYTETHKPEDKQEMDKHTKEHILEFSESVKEMYRNADPDIKRDMKEKLTKLVNELM